MKAAPDKPSSGRPCVLYLRRSTSLQDQSIGSQRDYLTRYAAEHELEVVREYMDDAVSGTSVDGRAGFQRLIADAQGKADFRAVLCYDTKRFSRGDLDEVGHFRYLLRQRGIEIIYATENFADDFTGEILRPIKQVMARQESVDLSKVTLRGHLTSINSGAYIGGVPPHGYDYLYLDSAGNPIQLVRYTPDGAKEIMTPDGVPIRRVPQGERLTVSRQDRIRLVPSLPARVEAIRRIFHLYIRERLGFRSIASRLNAEGVESPRSGQWGGTFYDGRWGLSTIRNIVVNPTYCGDTVWNRRTEGKFHRVSDGVAVARPRELAGIARANPQEDWVIIPDTHEPIITRTVFEAAKKVRTHRDESGAFAHLLLGRGRTSNFLLAGLITCEACGHRFTGWSHKLKRKVKPAPEDRHQVYLCGGYVRKGVAVCRRVAIEKQPLEEFIIGRVYERLTQILDGGGMSLLREYVQEDLAQAVSNPREELASVEAELGRLKADADRLLANLTEANREFIDEKLLEMKRRRRELEARRDALRQAADRTIDLDAATEAALGLLGRFRQVLDCGTFAEQKEFLGAFVAGITLHPYEKRGVLHMRDMVAASICISGWNRPKLYRRMQRFSIPGNYGRP